MVTRTLVTTFLERAGRHGGREALRALASGGAPLEECYTWAEWERAARTVAGALVAAGYPAGSRIAILAGNVPLWPIADLGVLMAGMVSVGIYPTSAPAQVGRTLADCGAVVVLVDAQDQLAKVAQVRGELPALATVVTAEGVFSDGAVSWSRWLKTGEAALRPGMLKDEVDRRIAAAHPDDPAALIYTSGSTGEPKGAVLTHRYLAASAAAIATRLGLLETDSGLSFLPFCHAGERVFGQATRIHAGMACGMVADHNRIAEAAGAYGPTVFGGLPRLYEKAVEAIRAAGPGATPAAYFGSRMRLATSGGASYPTDSARFLKALGLEVLGAYGLTEHLCVCMARPGGPDFETAGVPLGSTRIAFAEDGELLVQKGDLTFAGYFGRPEESRAAFTADGAWLLTGDLGTQDQEGRVRIDGRKKELIALSSGKKVAPLPIEARLTEDPLIAQAMLYGESRPFIAALLSPDRAALLDWARTAGIGAEWPDLLGDSRVRARIQSVIDRVNADLSRPEQVRSFALLDRELSLDHDELTPTLKLRRTAIAERHRERLDALYGRN